LQDVLDCGVTGCETAIILPHGYIPWPPRGCDPGVFPFLEVIVNRCVFLVDGLNLYHSLLDGEAVVYFSAAAHHREQRHPGTVARQVSYFSALEATGVDVHLGQFKARTLHCPVCGARFVGWEETETDVAIGARLLEYVCRGACDTAVLVTGDTDLVPAMRAARRLDPAKRLAVLQPYRRANRELARCADDAIAIRVASYARQQLAPH
jgi:uncharacterized LabA/DUF88 family protein